MESGEEEKVPSKSRAIHHSRNHPSSGAQQLY